MLWPAVSGGVKPAASCLAALAVCKVSAEYCGSVVQCFLIGFLLEPCLSAVGPLGAAPVRLHCWGPALERCAGGA